MNLGLIGLGLVGNALVKRFTAAGYYVIAFDIDPEACKRATQAGATVVADARDVGRQCPIIVLSLPDSTARSRLLWNDQRLADELSAGTVILDTTTGSPKDTLNDGEKLSKQDVRLIDVSIVGSSAEVAAGQAIALAGDTAEQADYEAIMLAFARRVFFLGRPGAGNHAKLVVNLVLGLNRLVLAEGLGLAGKAGLDRNQMLGILRSSGAYSRVMDTKGERMIRGDFEPVARLRQHAKDVDLILNLARQVNARTPVSELHARLLEKTIEAGWGDLDNAAIYKLFEI